jgi:uncharacterized protein (DUF736 family)
MPQYEKRDNSGALFKNDKKGDNEKAPDYKGQGTIDGGDYWFAGWRKTSEKGTQYLSLAFTVKDETPQKRKPDTANNDIPF